MAEHPAVSADRYIADLKTTTGRLLDMGADAVLLVVFDVPVPEPTLFGVKAPNGDTIVGPIAHGRAEVLRHLADLGHEAIDVGRCIDAAMRNPTPLPSGCTTRVMGLRVARPGEAPWRPDVMWPPEPVPNVRL